MKNRVVDITWKGKTEEYEIPSDVSNEKIPEYIEYVKSCLDYDNFDKSFVASSGHKINFPHQNWKKIVAKWPNKSDREKAAEKQKQVSKLLMAKMSTKRKVYGNAKKKALIALEDKWSSFMLELLGKDYSCAEVHKQLLAQGSQLDYQHVLDFARRNQEKIRELRNTFREDINDVSISIKRSRLEKLNYLLNSILQDFDEANTPSEREKLSKEARGILDQARKEVEGEEIKLTVNGRIDIEATINIYMQDTKLLQGLTIKQLVLSRVAARVGVNPMYFVNRLAHGFYSKFNGFRRNEDLSTKPIYPSAVNYDILELEEKYNRKAVEVQQEMEIQDAVIVEEDQEKALTTRDLLNSKIQRLIDQNKQTGEQLGK